MKRVIRFSRARYYFFGFSALLILIGIGGYVVNHGLNLGVDFKAGINFQFQVAPASFTVLYTGPDRVEISIPAGEQAITSPGDIIFKVTSATNGNVTSYPFSYKNYSTVKDLTDAIQKQVAGISVGLKGDPSIAPTELIPLPRPAVITGTAFAINRAPGPGRGVETSISEVRGLLVSLGENNLQAVGAPENQEFIARFPVQAEANEASFQTDIQKTLLGALEGKFGAGQVIIKSTEFVGPRMAQSLASQTFWLVLIAVALILVYMTFRFHPWIFAAAAVLGILHDALVMLSFDAVFRIEIDAGTIAAILTILGYSINDTIVNFDRARENNSLMRGESLRTILDTSVTQTLSRTFITSGATLLTVIALAILTTGTIKNFAINMIVGIVEGTYSTFISAFIVIEWTTWRNKKRKSGELKKYGITPSEKMLAVEPVQVDAEEEAEEAEEAPEGFVPAEFAVAAPGGIRTESAAGSIMDNGDAAPQQALPQAQPNVIAFPGNTGSRKHKKHRRRHH
jgi:preprotein translocase subunit SecF